MLKPSRTEGNTRLYTDEDLERLEFILNLARDLGVNIAGIAIILQMRERMEEMNRQMQSFVEYVRSEMLTRFQQGAPSAGRDCADAQAGCRQVGAGAQILIKVPLRSINFHPQSAREILAPYSRRVFLNLHVVRPARMALFGLITSTVFAGMVLAAVPRFLRERRRAENELRQRPGFTPPLSC